MLQMDGLQFASVIAATQAAWENPLKKDNIHRAIKIRATCPVIAVTAYRDQSIPAKAKKVGIKKVLQKPVDFR